MSVVVATNRQRLSYLLDVLAEPFPDTAKKQACNCGAEETNSVKNETENETKNETENKAPQVTFTTKRDLIEGALLDALGGSMSSFQSALDKMSDAQVGTALLTHVDVDMVDRHLHDLDLFATRPTTLDELKAWDTAHKNDTFQ